CGRVEEAVRVVDAEPGHLALLDEPKDQAMGLVEDFGTLDTHPGEAVDVEEATVVDLLGGDAPEGQTVGLVIEHPLQVVEVVWLAAPGIVLDQRGPESRAESSGLLVQREEAPPGRPALPASFGDAGQLRVVARREVA